MLGVKNVQNLSRNTRVKVKVANKTAHFFWFSVYHVVFVLNVGSRYGHEVCSYDELQCDNGKCLSSRSHCNGIDECGDGTDERHCPSRELAIIIYCIK